MQLDKLCLLISSTEKDSLTLLFLTKNAKPEFKHKETPDKSHLRGNL